MIKVLGKDLTIQKMIIFSIIIFILLLTLPSTIIGDSHFESGKSDKTLDVEFDDCNSIEINIEKIENPPKIANIGIHNVSVQYSAIGVTINGKMDFEENEPWIEHEKSPDNNGFPVIEFYISYDGNFKYLAFENNNHPITAIELFIDSNSNDSWDGPNKDIFLNANSDDMKIKDNNGDIIPNSLINWGYLVEMKIPNSHWAESSKWAFRIRSEGSTSWNPNWGDNDHSSTTPPDHKFLDFPCGPLDNCSCGISFKSLADIYEIKAGDYHILYETDFEEDYSNITQDWKAISIDEDNSDTWDLTTKRYRSKDYSFHCTQNDNYYHNNAYDVLEMKNPINLSGFYNVSFSFFNWCEGDSINENDYLQITDYGDIEFYTYIDSSWMWISLMDLCINDIYYDNGWVKSTINIDSSKTYKVNGENILGENLLQDENKFRFIWKSDSQFQNEGWYVDDIEIGAYEHEWYDGNQPIWSSHTLPPHHWCIPFGSTEYKIFPIQWNANKEGKYLFKNEIYEDDPWCGNLEIEKKIIIGDFHDVSLTSMNLTLPEEPTGEVTIEGIIRNVGTVIETDLVVQASIRLIDEESTIWERTKIIPSVDVFEEKNLKFIWENPINCNSTLIVRVILPEDENPQNNSMVNELLVTDIDDNPPETSCVLSGSTGENNWFVGPVEITLTAVDDYSGLKNIFYQLDDGEQTTYSSSFLVDDDGYHSIKYWAEDNNGNKEDPHGLKSFNIDTIAPIVEITRPDNGFYWRNHKIWPLTEWSLFDWAPPIIIRDITVRADARDVTSGLYYLEFYVDDVLISPDETESYEWNWDDTIFFSHEIKIKAYDKAGNTNSVSKEVYIFNIDLFG